MRESVRAAALTCLLAAMVWLCSGCFVYVHESSHAPAGKDTLSRKTSKKSSVRIAFFEWPHELDELVTDDGD